MQQLLPTAFGNLLDPCLPDLFTVYYPPMPGVIMMVSLFCLFVVELWLNGKIGGHSHGGPTGYDANSHSHAMVAAAPQRPPRYNMDSFDSEEDLDLEKRLAQKL